MARNDDASRNPYLLPPWVVDEHRMTHGLSKLNNGKGSWDGFTKEVIESMPAFWLDGVNEFFH